MKARLSLLSLFFIGLLVAPRVGWGQNAAYNTPTVNGTIAASEYGIHTDGKSQNTNGITTYMTWNATNLFVGISSSNTGEATVIYLDKDGNLPANSGTGTQTGYNAYDGTSFAALPFNADVAIYAKSGYIEYRVWSGAAWGSAVTASTAVSGSGNPGVLEFSIPWAGSTGGLPSKFNFFSYKTSSGGFVYGQLPNNADNPGGSIGTSARYARYYTVSNTTNTASSTFPFSQESYTFVSTTDINSFGAISVWDLNMNSSGRQIARSGATNWTLGGTLAVGAGSVYFGSGGTYGSTSIANVKVTGGLLSMDASTAAVSITTNVDISGGTLDMGTGSNTTTIGGAYSQTAGTYTGSSGSRAFSLTGALTLSGGTMDLGSGTGGTSIGGAVTQSGGTLTLGSGSSTCSVTGAYSQTAGTLSMGTGSGTFTISGAGGYTPSSTAAFSGSSSTRAFNLVGPFTMSTTGTVALSTNSAFSMNIGGNWSQTNGTFTPNSSTVVFNGSAAQAIGGTSAPSFYRLTISNSAANVTINISTTVTNKLDVNGSATTTRLDVASSKTLTLTGSSSTVTSGFLRNSGGTITSTGSELTFAAAGQYENNVNGGTIPTAVWSPGSTCNIIGNTSTSTAPGGLGQSFSNFTWNSTGQTQTVGLSGGLTTINGNFTMQSTGSASVRLASMQNTTTAVGGNLVINGGTLAIASGATSSGTYSLNVAGKVSIPSTSTGTLTITTSTNTANATLSVTGNFEIAGGAANLSGAMAGTGSANLNVTGDLLLSGGTFDMSAGGAVSNFNLTGNFNQTGGTFQKGGGVSKITFNKASGLQTWNESGGSIGTTYMLWQVGTGSSSNTVQLSSNVVLGSSSGGTAANLTVMTGSTLDFQTYTVSTNGGTISTFTSNAGSTLITANSLGILSAVTGTTGSLIINGATGTGLRTFTAGTNFTFNGASPQSTGTAIAQNAAGTLTISNSSGVTLNSGGTTTISALAFTAGTLDIGANQLINSGTANATGFGASSYVINSGAGTYGYSSLPTSTTVTLPIGTASYYLPLVIATTQASKSYYALAQASLAGTPFDATQAVNAGWAITSSATAADITFSWNGANENGSFLRANPLEVGFTTGGAYTITNTGLSTVGSGPYTVTAPGATIGTARTYAVGNVNSLLSATSTYTWTGGTNSDWNNAGNWTGGATYPSSTDNVVINIPGTNTLLITTGYTPACANFTLSGTGTFGMNASTSLTINGTVVGGSSATPTLNATSTVTYAGAIGQLILPMTYGNLAAGAGPRTLSPTGTISIAGTYTPGTGTTATGSTVDFIGAAGQVIPVSSYNNISSSVNNTRTLANGLITITGTYTPPTSAVITPGTSTVDFAGAAGQVIPTGKYYTITNSVNNTRSFASTGNNANVIEIGNSFTGPTSAAVSYNTSTVKYTAAAPTLTGFTGSPTAARQYYDLIITSSGNVFPASTYTAPGIAHDFTIALSNSAGIFCATASGSTSTFTWTVDNNLNLSGVTSSNVTFNSGGANTATINVSGNTTISSGILLISRASTVAGSVANLSTTDLTINGTGIVKMDDNTNSAYGVVTINGALNISSTSNPCFDLASGTSNANTTVNLKGAFNKTAGGAVGTSGTLSATNTFNFNSSGTQSFSYAGTAISGAGGNYVVANGTTLTLSSAFALPAAGASFTVSGSLSPGANVVSSTGNSTTTFMLSGTGVLNLASSSGYGGSFTGFTAANTTFSTGATFNFAGTSQSTGFTSPVDVSAKLSNTYNVSWNGTTSLTLDASLPIGNNTFAYTNAGLINLGANSITLGSTATLSGSPFSVTKMFVADGAGSLVRSVASGGGGLPFTFPIGDNTSGADYSPVTLSSATTTGGTIGFRVVDAVDPNNGLASNYLSRYWVATGTLSYSALAGNFTYVSADITGTEGSLKLNAYTAANGYFLEYTGTSSASSNVLTFSSGPTSATLTPPVEFTGRTDIPVYYRSRVSGQTWATANTWEVSTDPAFVSPAPVTSTTVPNANNSGGITIQSPHTVTASASTSADQFTINIGGTLAVTAGTFSVPDGLLTDLTVNGLMTVGSAATLTFASGTTSVIGTNPGTTTGIPTNTTQGYLKVSALAGNTTFGGTFTINGVYENNADGGTAPSGTWATGSLYYLTGMGSATAIGNQSQTFYNYTINNTGQFGAYNYVGVLSTINGDLTVASTGSSSARLIANSGIGVLTVNGNVLVIGGILDMCSGTGNSQIAINGNMTLTGGTWDMGTGSSVGASYVTLKGNYKQNGGALGWTGGGVARFYFGKTSGTQTIEQTSGAINGQVPFFFNGGGTAQLISNFNAGTSALAFDIASGTTLDMQAYVITGGGTTPFNTVSGSILKIGNVGGITATGTGSGNVQVSGTRVYNASANYIYTPQTGTPITGGGLPASNSGTVTINPASGITVTLSNVPTTFVNLTLSSGLFATGAAGNVINIPNSGTLNGSGGLFATGATAGTVNCPSGTIVFNGTLNPYNVTASGGINFGASTTIQTGGSFTINSGGYALTNAPTYASGSTLVYQPGGTSYGRGLEWSASSGKGYPSNVSITGGTTFTSLSTNPFTMGGNLSVVSGSNIYLDYGGAVSTVNFTVAGNVNMAGNISLSTTSGDWFIGGDFTRSGVLNTNNREVVFNGTGAQSINGTTTFDYLRIKNTATAPVGVTLASGNIIANQRIAMESGLLIIGNNNVTVSNTGFTFGGATNYIVQNGTGTVTQGVDNTAHLFPIGPNTTQYAPVTLTQAGTAENITAKVTQPGFTNAVNDATKVVKLEWTLSESNAGANNLVTTFGWTAASEGAAFDRTSSVYHGAWNTGTTKYDVRLGGVTFGATVFYNTATANYTDNLGTQFVIGNYNGIKPCATTASAGDWNTNGTWADNTPPPDGAAVCLAHAVTIASVDPTGLPSLLTFNASSSLNISNGRTLTVKPGVIISNASGVTQNMTTGKILSQGSITVNGANPINFAQLSIQGGATFTTAPTINTALEILSGGFVSGVNAPNYATGSILSYNTGGTYGRSLEWSATSGAGFPYNVQVGFNTTLDIANGNNGAKAIGNNIIIDLGSIGTMSAMTGALTVPGNFTLNGTFVESSVSGGDLIVGGDWSSGASAVLTSNNRDVRFNNATVTQNITTAASLTFGYLTIDNASASGVNLVSPITAYAFRINPSRTFSVSADNITILAGGDLNVGSGATFNANTLVMNYNNGGTWTNNGTFNYGTSTINFNGTATGTITGSVLTNFWNINMAPSSQLDFGTGALRGHLFGTLELRAGSYVSHAPYYEAGSKLRYAGGGSFNRTTEWDNATIQKVEVSNNTTVNTGASGNSGYAVNLADSLWVRSGSTFNLNAPAMSVASAFGGTLRLEGTLVLSATSGSDISVGGDWVNNGGTFTPNDRLVTFTGPTNASVTGSSATTFPFVTVNKDYNKKVTVATATTLSRTGGTSLRVQSGILDLNNQVVTLGPGSNALRVDAGFTNGQTLRTGGSDISGFAAFTNGVVNDSLGGKVDFSGSSAETVLPAVKGYNLLWLTGAATKSISQNTAVADSLYIGTGSTLSLGATAAIIRARGHVVNNNVMSGTGTGKLLLAGGAAQNVSGTGTYRNLEVYNANGVNTIGTQTVNNSLIVTKGKVNTGTDKIVLTSAATVAEAINSSVDQNFVRGYLETTRTVGTAGETFGGMGIELTPGANVGNVTATRQSGTAVTGQGVCCTAHHSIIRTWQLVVTQQPATANRNLKLIWPSQDDNGMNTTMMQMWKSPDGIVTYDKIGYVQNLSAGFLRKAEIYGIPSFSVFTGADDINPLPLGLLTFEGRYAKGDGLLNWTMTNEGGWNSFVVERSYDGKSFSPIGNVDVAADANARTSNIYRFADRGMAQSSYYRLRLVGSGGKTDYSQAVYLRLGAVGQVHTLSLYPNPATEAAQLTLDGATEGADHITTHIYATDGRQIAQLQGTLTEVNAQLATHTAALPAGAYHLRIQTADDVQTLKLVKE